MVLLHLFTLSAGRGVRLFAVSKSRRLGLTDVLLGCGLALGVPLLGHSASEELMASLVWFPPPGGEGQLG
jgi:hypothetical protein